MGRFIYDSSIKEEFEDRLLAHLQAVIVSKLRRGESFTFTWKDDISTGGGADLGIPAAERVAGVQVPWGAHPAAEPGLASGPHVQRQLRPRLVHRRRTDGGVRAPEPHKEMVFGEVPADAPLPPQQQ